MVIATVGVVGLAIACNAQVLAEGPPGELEANFAATDTRADSAKDAKAPSDAGAPTDSAAVDAALRQDSATSEAGSVLGASHADAADARADAGDASADAGDASAAAIVVASGVFAPQPVYATNAVSINLGPDPNLCPTGGSPRGSCCMANSLYNSTPLALSLRRNGASEFVCLDLPNNHAPWCIPVVNNVARAAGRLAARFSNPVLPDSAKLLLNWLGLDGDGNTEVKFVLAPARTSVQAWIYLDVTGGLPQGKCGVLTFRQTGHGSPNPIQTIALTP